MRALVVGNGYIGSRMAQALRDHPGVLSVDIATRSDNLSGLVGNIRPHVIFNCAGYTGSPTIDSCSAERAKTVEDNVILPRHLTVLAQTHSTKLVHISSGCIYNGTEYAYTEADAPNFWGSFYGATKMIAEQIVAQYPKHYCMRMNMLFSEAAESKNLLYRLSNYQRLVDMRHSMTHIDDGIKAIIHLVYNQVPFGIYNVVNPGSITIRDIARGIKLKADWVSREEFRMMVKDQRSESMLDTRKLEMYYKMRPIEDAMRKTMKQFRSNNGPQDQD